ncbi:MAG TPA: alpha/beta fold hydrolase [Oligoflexia bacterium]|nr:alpha/beta fold hydrolase [Oligoflexia bacterium]HMR24814.1 alpha/beta fold hydrolase [Oligoflexia bacterium]
MFFNSSNSSPANVSKLSANATSFLKGDKDITLICVHGFTGSSHDFSIVAPYLKNLFNINCISLSLPGHTGKIEDLKAIQYQDWLNVIQGHIDSCLEKNHQVHLMGLSMGGSLAMIIAAQLQDKIKSMTLFSPAIWIINRKQDLALYYLSKLPRFLIPNITIKKDKKKNEVLLFESYPLQALAEYKKVTLLAKDALPKINCPSLVIYSDDDDVISPKSSQFIYKHNKNKINHILNLKHAGHIIPMIQDQEQASMLNALKTFYTEIF